MACCLNKYLKFKFEGRKMPNDRGCHNCRAIGHVAKDCPKKSKKGNKNAKAVPTIEPLLIDDDDDETGDVVIEEDEGEFEEGSAVEQSEEESAEGAEATPGVEGELFRSSFEQTENKLPVKVFKEDDCHGVFKSIYGVNKRLPKKSYEHKVSKMEFMDMVSSLLGDYPEKRAFLSDGFRIFTLKVFMSFETFKPIAIWTYGSLGTLPESIVLVKLLDKKDCTRDSLKKFLKLMARHEEEIVGIFASLSLDDSDVLSPTKIKVKTETTTPITPIGKNRLKKDRRKEVLLERKKKENSVAQNSRGNILKMNKILQKPDSEVEMNGNCVEYSKGSKSNVESDNLAKESTLATKSLRNESSISEEESAVLPDESGNALNYSEIQSAELGDLEVDSNDSAENDDDTMKLCCNAEDIDNSVENSASTVDEFHSLTNQFDSLNIQADAAEKDSDSTVDSDISKDLSDSPVIDSYSPSNNLCESSVVPLEKSDDLSNELSTSTEKKVVLLRATSTSDWVDMCVDFSEDNIDETTPIAQSSNKEVTTSSEDSKPVKKKKWSKARLRERKMLEMTPTAPSSSDKEVSTCSKDMGTNSSKTSETGNMHEITPISHSSGKELSTSSSKDSEYYVLKTSESIYDTSEETIRQLENPDVPASIVIKLDVAKLKDHHGENFENEKPAKYSFDIMRIHFDMQKSLHIDTVCHATSIPFVVNLLTWFCRWTDQTLLLTSLGYRVYPIEVFSRQVFSKPFTILKYDYSLRKPNPLVMVIQYFPMYAMTGHDSYVNKYYRKKERVNFESTLKFLKSEIQFPKFILNNIADDRAESSKGMNMTVLKHDTNSKLFSSVDMNGDDSWERKSNGQAGNGERRSSDGPQYKKRSDENRSAGLSVKKPLLPFPNLYHKAHHAKPSVNSKIGVYPKAFKGDNSFIHSVNSNMGASPKASNGSNSGCEIMSSNTGAIPKVRHVPLFQPLLPTRKSDERQFDFDQTCSTDESSKAPTSKSFKGRIFVKTGNKLSDKKKKT